MRIGHGLAGLALAFALVAQALPASAQTIMTSQRDTAAWHHLLEIQFQGLADARRASILCFEEEEPEAHAEYWSTARAQVIATLHANGFDPDFVAHADAVLGGGAEPDCGSPVLEGTWRHYTSNPASWTYHAGGILGGIGISMLRDIPDPESLAAIAAILAEEAHVQRRILGCRIAEMPFSHGIGLQYRSWSTTVLILESRVARLGYSPQDIEAAFSGARLDDLSAPASEELAAYVEDCAADREWQRAYREGSLSVARERIEAILDGGPER